MAGKTTFDDLVQQFSQTVGVEKAKDIVRSAAETSGIERDNGYTNDEVIEIATTVRNEHEGYISIVAHELQVKSQANKRFYTLLENIPDPAIVIHYEDEPVVKSVNQAFESCFGYEEDEILGEPINEFIIPGESHDEATEIDNQLKAGNRVEQELDRQTSDGEIRNFLFRGVPTDSESNSLEAYGIYTDITDRKKREEELQRKNQRLEQFADVVSHDLRNPLNVATGRLQLGRETGDDEHFEKVAETHERMEELIDNLLTLAKKGQTVGETVPIDLSVIVEDVFSTIDAPSLTLEKADDLETIRADADRITEVFENLFMNAEEYATRPADDGESKNEVTVTVGMLEDGFYIADDGQGIPPEDRDDVFEHGFTTSKGGTGFGLAIVESIVNAHGWDISVTESAEGGARFDITDVPFV